MRFQVPADALSWVDYGADSCFPIQNIPFGACLIDGEEVPRPCTAIGEYVVDLALLEESGLIDGYGLRACARPLDSLLGLGTSAISNLRKSLFELLHEDEERLQSDEDLQAQAFILQSEVQMVLGFSIGSFVDFYSGIHHASNVGRMFRPDQPPLLPNYRWLPIGYNGRASTVGLSRDIRRPNGQTKDPTADSPTFGPTRELDFELEMGFVLGNSNNGIAWSPDEAESHMAGIVVVNDWSARDVQRWEYQPLGPFLSKSFATTVSPWLVTLDALEPFRISGMAQEPEPLDHLQSRLANPHFDVQLEVSLQTARMSAPQVICRSNMKNLYWSMAQQLAHQTSNGTLVHPGDLYASGTISGEDKGSFGSMLELTWKGQEPILMQESGETRSFVEDGDTVTMTAFAQGEGFRIGFGEAKGTIVPG